MARVRAAVPFALALLVALQVGCAAVSSSGDNEWSSTYVGPRQRVWTEVLRTLDQLAYEIEEASAGDGRVRAAETGTPPYWSIVLDIRVVAGPELVRVDVQAAGGRSPGPDRFRALDEAVQQFLDVLDRRLGSAR